jgi:hypothetical protein
MPIPSGLLQYLLIITLLLVLVLAVVIRVLLRRNRILKDRDAQYLKSVQGRLWVVNQAPKGEHVRIIPRPPKPYNYESEI